MLHFQRRLPIEVIVGKAFLEAVTRSVDADYFVEYASKLAEDLKKSRTDQAAASPRETATTDR